MSPSGPSPFLRIDDISFFRPLSNPHTKSPSFSIPLCRPNRTFHPRQPTHAPLSDTLFLLDSNLCILGRVTEMVEEGL
jgi:hypothetical protein